MDLGGEEEFVEGSLIENWMRELNLSAKWEMDGVIERGSLMGVAFRFAADQLLHKVSLFSPQETHN